LKSRARRRCGWVPRWSHEQACTARYDPHRRRSAAMFGGTTTAYEGPLETKLSGQHRADAGSHGKLCTAYLTAILCRHDRNRPARSSAIDTPFVWFGIAIESPRPPFRRIAYATYWCVFPRALLHDASCARQASAQRSRRSLSRGKPLISRTQRPCLSSQVVPRSRGVG
jgi:hypothetical protein